VAFSLRSSVRGRVAIDCRDFGLLAAGRVMSMVKSANRRDKHTISTRPKTCSYQTMSLNDTIVDHDEVLVE
jgi:hypothetical protein